MTARTLTRRFVALRAMRWLPLGIALPFLILLPEDRGLSLAAIGVAWAVHSVVTLVLEVPSGAFADAVGRRTALLLGAGLTSLGLAIFAIAAALPAFMAAAGAIAAGRALISGSLEAWFVDALRALDAEASLREPLAAGATGEALGMAIGSLTGGLLPLLAGGLDRTGDALLVQLSLPMVAAALAALVYLLAVLLYVDEPRRRTAAGWRRATADSLAVGRRGIAMARRSHNVRVLLGIALAIGLVMSSVELLWQPRLEDIVGRDATDVAPVFGALSAAAMLACAAGAVLSPRIARLLGARSAYIGSFAIMAAMVGLLAAAGVTALFCAAYLLYFWSLGVIDPLHYEILHEATDGSVRATVVSAESLTSQAGGVGANLTAGAVAGASGIWVVWTVSAVVALVAALLARGVRVAPAAATPRPRPAAPSGVA
ncbi:MAG TPA: MFS transporter [Solirubrobacteraceae bacterium]|nr:MFS transporter [Solirubrobacteraceae bacterium]